MKTDSPGRHFTPPDASDVAGSVDVGVDVGTGVGIDVTVDVATDIRELLEAPLLQTQVNNLMSAFFYDLIFSSVLRGSSE